MDRYIAWENEEGVVCTFYIHEKSRIDGESDEDFIARMIQSEAPGITDYKVILPTKMPTVQMYSEALKLNQVSITVDNNKLRERHLDEIRKFRDAKLTQLDKPELIARSKNDQEELDDILTQKQTLRDLPETVDLNSLNSPEEIVAVWPTELEV